MQERDDAHGMVFTQDDLSEAIQYFFEIKNLNLLQFKFSKQENIAAHSPEYKVQRKGSDETDIRYELSPDASSAMVDVLIAAHYARHQRSIARTSEFATDLIILA